MKLHPQAISRHRPDCIGNTIVELAVALAIIAITAKGIGSLASTTRHAYELRSTLQSVLSLAELGSFAARQSRRDVLLHADIPGARFTVSDEGTLLREEYHLPPSIVIQEFSVGAVGQSDAIQFFPDGSASPGRITLASIAGTQCTIYQALRGARRWLFHD